MQRPRRPPDVRCESHTRRDLGSFGGSPAACNSGTKRADLRHVDRGFAFESRPADKNRSRRVRTVVPSTERVESKLFLDVGFCSREYGQASELKTNKGSGRLVPQVVVICGSSRDKLDVSVSPHVHLAEGHLDTNAMIHLYSCPLAPRRRGRLLDTIEVVAEMNTPRRGEQGHAPARLVAGAPSACFPMTCGRAAFASCSPRPLTSPRSQPSGARHDGAPGHPALAPRSTHSFMCPRALSPRPFVYIPAASRSASSGLRS